MTFGAEDGDVAAGFEPGGGWRVTDDGPVAVAVSGGFAEIEGDTVRVLAENALTEEKIDEAAV